MSARFRPAAPFRPSLPPPLWRRLSGELATNWVAGWPRGAFRERYMFARVLTVRNHIVNDPDAIGHVLKEAAANYEKPALIKRILAPSVGWNLLVSDGEAWREQRRLMAPVFTPAAVDSFNDLFQSVGRAQADGWAHEPPGRVDVAAAATRATFEVMSRALFSGDPALSSEAASAHIGATLASAGKYSVAKLIGAPWLDRSRIRREGIAGAAFLRERLTELIARRKADPAAPKDFMTRLLDAFAESRPPEEAAELALGNGILFFVAGHETTANALTWALYLLGGDREAQERAAAEAQAALAGGGGPGRILGRLDYLRQVLDESMRLYPPAALIARRTLREVRLGDHTFAAGSPIRRPPASTARRSRTTCSAGGGSAPATWSPSGPGCCIATRRCGTSRTCSIRSAFPQRAAPGSTATSTSPSAQGRASASGRRLR
jgi:cytochrome P450